MTSQALQDRGELIAARRLGLVLVAGAATVWSTGGAIARMIEADPWTTVFWRSLSAALALLLFIGVRERGEIVTPFRKLGWPGLVTALCFTMASTAFIVALRLTTVANVLILQATAPFIAGILGWIFLGERVRLRSWLTMAAALMGIAVMVSDSLSQGSLLGLAVSLLVGLGFGGAIVMTRRYQHVRMAPATCLATLFGALIAAPLAAPLDVSANDLALCFLFGAGQLAVGLVLFTYGARLAPAAEVGIVSVLENILGPLWVWLAFSENPGGMVILGGAIVLAALVVHTILDLSGKRPVPPAT
jgi:drug/metabolite transporter (DMT)-like permease